MSLAAREVHQHARGNNKGKRHTRTPLACDFCREHKVRCSGTKPVCARCQMRGLTESQCVYSTNMNPGRIDSQREYIKILHDRIRQLEDSTQSSTANAQSAENSAPDQVNSLSEIDMTALEGHEHLLADVHDDRNTGSTSMLPTPKTTTTSTRITDSSAPKRTSSQSSRGLVSRLPLDNDNASQPTNSQDSPPSPSVDDKEHFGAMGVVYSIESDQQSPDPAFYGKSSVASLLSSIPSNPARERSNHNGPRQPLVSLGHRTSFSRPARPGALRNRLWFPLPPRTVADDLLGQYWTNNHLYYPWFHTQSFQNAYEALWARSTSRPPTDTLPRVGLGGSDCSDHVFNVALNTAFALGCEGSKTATDQPEDAAADFMDRAFGLLHTDLLDDPTLSLVQTLLLVIEYLQSTQKVNKTWSLVASVCAMAQGLGLHLSHNDSQYTVLEIEMRRRAWHGCVFYDRITSMTFGRFPVLLGAPKVPLFSAIDDEYLDMGPDSCLQPARELSRVAFAVENVKLGQILGDILQHLYSHQVGNDLGSKTSSSKSSPMMTTAFDALAVLDASLTDFEAQLPDQLKMKRCDDQGIDQQELEMDFLRQSYVLRARTLHARLMLFRPSFCKVCAQPQQNGRSPDEQSGASENKMETIAFVFEFQCALACYRASCDMIQLLHNAVIKEIWGAWWYAIYYIASSAIILILGANDNRIDTDIGDGRFNARWHMAIETLGILNRKHPMAGQCAMALQAIRQRCFGASKGRKSNSSQCQGFAPDAQLGSTLPTRHPETDILPLSMTSSSIQVDPFSMGEPLRPAPGDWQPWLPTLQASAGLNEMDLDNFGDTEGFLPLLENLQNSFGSGMVTGILGQFPDTSHNNWIGF